MEDNAISCPFGCYVQLIHTAGRRAKQFVDFISNPAMQPYLSACVTGTVEFFDVDSNVAEQFQQFINLVRTREKEMSKTTGE